MANKHQVNSNILALTILTTISMFQDNSNCKMLVGIHSTQLTYKNSHLLVSLNREVVQDKIKASATLVHTPQQGNLRIMKYQTKVNKISLSQEH